MKTRNPAKQAWKAQNQHERYLRRIQDATERRDLAVAKLNKAILDIVDEYGLRISEGQVFIKALSGTIGMNHRIELQRRGTRRHWRCEMCRKNQRTDNGYCQQCIDRINRDYQELIAHGPNPEPEQARQ